jgi:hypothetical protein
MDEHSEARGIEPACHGEILPRRPPACPSLYGGGQPRPAIFRGVRSLIFCKLFCVRRLQFIWKVVPDAAAFFVNVQRSGSGNY